MKKYDKHFFHIWKMYDNHFLSTRVSTRRENFVQEDTFNFLYFHEKGMLMEVSKSEIVFIKFVAK